MQITSTPTGNINLAELNNAKNADPVKNAQPLANPQGSNPPEEEQKEATGSSASIPLPTRGTITYSANGDTFENKTAVIKTVGEPVQNTAKPDANASANADLAQTSSVDTTSEETTSESSSVSNSTAEAINMLAHGYSDAKIKEKTGLSQQEIDKLRQGMDVNNPEEF